MSDYVAFTVRVPAAMHKKLKQRAQKRGVFLNYEANETLEAGLKARSDLFKRLVRKHVI